VVVDDERREDLEEMSELLKRVDAPAQGSILLTPNTVDR